LFACGLDDLILPETRFKTDSSALLGGSVADSNSTEQQTSTESTEKNIGDSISCNMIVDSVLLPGYPRDPLCERVRRLCAHDFRDQPWYLDNLYLISSYAIGAAAMILPFAKPSGVVVLAGLDLILAIGWSIIAVIPLCGIVDSIQRQEPSQRQAPLMIRLAVHPGKVYERSRWAYFVGVPVISIIVSPITYTMSGFATSFFIPVLIWALFSVVMSFRALWACLRSIYLQVPS
jgi:hypothetical protein